VPLLRVRPARQVALKEEIMAGLLMLVVPLLQQRHPSVLVHTRAEG
jgi:hypothetical protein